MMKYQKYTLLTILALAGIVFSGCNDGRPEGMPKLYPTKLILTYDDGTPVIAATVQLASTSGIDARWTPLGSTDAMGVLEPSVLGQYKGVPEGEWTVCVIRVKAIYTDEDLESEENSPNAAPGNRPVGRLTLVNPLYNKPETSPLTLTVKKGKNEMPLTVGEKLHDYVALKGRKGRDSLDEEED